MPKNKSDKKTGPATIAQNPSESGLNKLFQNWFVVGASVIGKSHTSTNTPCQDSYFNKVLSNDWGIAVICDGAGSATNSDVGSTFVATEAIPRVFEEIIIEKDWLNSSALPEPAEWEEAAKKGLKQVNGALRIFSDAQKYEFPSLACTAIIILYSPFGLLVTHIGDGRAGYCDEFGTWSSVMTPHKGEEANQTIFVTSGGWISDDKFTMSNVLVPESRVIKGKIASFILLSDGCEYHSFECSTMVDEGKWIDPNRPYPQFFDPLINTLKGVAVDKKTSLEAQDSWRQFLTTGTEGLKNEPDDKTMIIGVAI